MSKNELVARADGVRTIPDPKDLLMSILVWNEEEVGHDVQKESLMHFHHRLSHLNYNTIICSRNSHVFCERQFNCRIHVMRTDGCGEYRTLIFSVKKLELLARFAKHEIRPVMGKQNVCTMNMVEYDICLSPASLFLK